MPSLRGLQVGQPTIDSFPLAPQLLSPSANAQITPPYAFAFNWVAILGKTYEIQIASDVAFTDIIDSDTGLTSGTYTPSVALDYDAAYWRVRQEPDGEWATRAFELYEFVLYDEFTVDDAAPITSPRTAKPGPGTLTVTDPDTRLGISGGVVVSGAGATPATGYVAGPYTRQTGLALIAQVTRTSNNAGVGWETIATLQNDYDTLVYGHKADFFTALSDNNGGTIVNLPFLASVNAVAIVLRSTGARYFRRVGSTWRRMFTSHALNTTPLYAQYLFRTGVISNDFIKIDLLGTPWDDDWGDSLFTDTTLTTGDIFSGVANGEFEFQFALPGAPNAGDKVELIFRRQDASNYWTAYCERNIGNTAWDYKVDSVVASTPTNRFTATNVGAVNAIKIMAIGSLIGHYTRVGSNWTTRTEISNSTHNAQTGIEVLFVAGTTASRLTCWEETSALYSVLETPNFSNGDIIPAYPNAIIESTTAGQTFESQEVEFEAGFDREIDTPGSDPADYLNVSDGALILHSNVTLKNLVIHNTPSNLYMRSPGGLIEGVISVHGGWRSTADRPELLVNLTTGGGHGHAIYCASEATGLTTVRKNYFGSCFGYGGHFYTTNGYLRGLRINQNFFRKRFIIGSVGANNPEDNQITNNWFWGDQFFLGYFTDTNDLLVDGNTFYVDNAGSIRLQEIQDLTFTNNRVIATNRTLNYIPHTTPGTLNVDNNIYYTLLSPNKSAPFLINYNAVSFATWKTNTGFDANSTVIDDAMPANDVTILTLNSERALGIIENWSDAASVDVSLAALDLQPSQQYEFVNLENLAENITFLGSDVIANGNILEVDMTTWTQAKPVNWTPDWWPLDLSLFSAYLVRRVGSV